MKKLFGEVVAANDAVLLGLTRDQTKELGTIRGSVGGSIRLPLPPAIQPVDLDLIAPLPILPTTREDAISEMVAAYRTCGSNRFIRKLFTLLKQDRSWSSNALIIGQFILNERVSPRLLVTFICERAEKLRGTFPYPEQVFSMKALRGWLPTYKSNAAAIQQHRVVAPLSPERAALYRQRVVQHRENVRTLREAMRTLTDDAATLEAQSAAWEDLRRLGVERQVEGWLILERCRVERERGNPNA